MKRGGDVLPIQGACMPSWGVISQEAEAQAQGNTLKRHRSGVLSTKTTSMRLLSSELVESEAIITCIQRIALPLCEKGSLNLELSFLTTRGVIIKFWPLQWADYCYHKEWSSVFTICYELPDAAGQEHSVFKKSHPGSTRGQQLLYYPAKRSASHEADSAATPEWVVGSSDMSHTHTKSSCQSLSCTHFWWAFVCTCASGYLQKARIFSTFFFVQRDGKVLCNTADTEMCTVAVGAY